MFSIIIPLYNKAPYIRQCVQTIMVQTLTNYEVIVVNDGSTDTSLENLLTAISDLQFPSEKIRIIDQKNHGVSVARNNGVKLARYDYIAFLDADDWWEPTYLEEMKGLIERFPEAGIYGSSYYKVKEDLKIPANIGVEDGFTEGEVNYFQVYAKTFYMPLWTGATVVKREVFLDENGFRPALKVGEDFDLWARIALKYPVVFLNKILSNYNQDVEVATSASRLKNYLPGEHMLFTDYSAITNADFQYLYQLLVIYGLLPNYLYNSNKKEVDRILSGIQWEKYPFKYRLYYRILPKVVVRYYFELLQWVISFKRQRLN